MRLLIGSLVLGSGIVALGLLFGGGTANAAEAPAPGPLGGVVATVASVTPAAPAPVREVAAQVVQPVASVVQQVAAAAPVEAVVNPVAHAAGRVVAAPVELVAPAAAVPAAGGGTTGAETSTSGASAQVADAPASQAPALQTALARLPLMGTLAAPLTQVTSVLANHPVSTLTAPIAAAADGVLAGVAGLVVGTVRPLAVPGAAGPGGEQTAIPLVDVQPAVAPASAAVERTVRAVAPYSPASVPTAGAASALLADAPYRDSDVPSPGNPSGVLGTSPGAAQSGGYSSGFATLGGSPAWPATAASVRAGLPADDDLPTSPVFDHDISPD
ncbi:hypothetical protein ACFRFH_06140 [Leifsonia sp. NPDC056824]|uniref:hypothetical protein n=1 Tax=Leifsonia sp. NPDC056824 TaxID=3345953 RepID=UPI00368585E6